MVSLSELRFFLSQRGAVPLMDMAHHFHHDPLVLRDMLSHWVRKGKVRVTTAQAACQSHCSGCGSGPTELYEWIGAPMGGGEVPPVGQEVQG